MIDYIKPSQFAERICAEKCRTTHHFMGFYVWHFMASLRVKFLIGFPIGHHFGVLNEVEYMEGNGFVQLFLKYYLRIQSCPHEFHLKIEDLWRIKSGTAALVISHLDSVGHHLKWCWRCVYSGNARKRLILEMSWVMFLIPCQVPVVEVTCSSPKLGSFNLQRDPKTCGGTARLYEWVKLAWSHFEKTKWCHHLLGRLWRHRASVESRILDDFITYAVGCWWQGVILLELLKDYTIVHSGTPH